jgi:3-oxoacyl-[acyl-carrier protein] reductase
MNSKKIILITGGTRGLGYQIALECLDLGYKIIVTSTKNKTKNDILNYFPNNINDIDHYVLDQSNEKSINKFLVNINKYYNKIDVLINNAGVNKRESFEKISIKTYDFILDTNLKGPFFLTQGLYHLLKKDNGGRIINISSVAGQYHGPFTAHYAISKAGLISFTKFIARYSAKDNIYCNALCPGLIRTDQTLDEFETTGNDIINMTLLKREGTYNDIRSSIKFLLDENQKYYTGQTINLSGGAIL